MKKYELLSDENKYAAAKQKSKRRSKILMCLAAAVVFCTSYALILPAITMEKEICTLDHEHTADCRLAEDAEKLAVILEDDSAYVSRLETTAITVIGENGSQQSSAAGCGDTVLFGFTAQTVSYDDKQFDEGRIKLEFVLPLSPEQAVFDVDAMTWIDGGTAVQTTEQREIDGQAVGCQILTCYGKLESKDESKPAVPSEFSESAVISVLKTEAGQQISLGISAAMEFNEWNGTCGTHNAVEKLTAQTASCVITESAAEEEDETETENDVNTYAETLSADDVDVDSIAEAAYGDNWKKLRDSGWFEEYAAYGTDKLKTKRTAVRAAQAGDTSPSAQQVDDAGGTNSADDGVSVSKTITGTDIENVFDISLNVETTQALDEFINEPDMAVVIVMDISNTMNETFSTDKTATRYKAAVEAAEDFLDKFAASNKLGESKVGYVAFNTDAHQIFDLKPCTNETQANTLKNMVRTSTDAIINKDGYASAHSRFTNIEAGLKMASDMLDGVSNKNKYIILLTDGFPTTYIESEYKGHDTYDKTGEIFYDKVLTLKCSNGTSYSDKAAIKAREMATSIKNSGKTIFSIGVDVEGQKIESYIGVKTDITTGKSFSIVDRTSETYEIGGASDTEAYKKWLKNSIGSGYYYDSTNTNELIAAYEQIFNEIKSTVKTGSQVDWVASDPLPILTEPENGRVVEFIGLYDKEGKLSNKAELIGEHIQYGENTASYDDDDKRISWDLKLSGYTTANANGKTKYTYTLSYRVRLMNESDIFTEGTVYDTNNPTKLDYRIVKTENGKTTVSEKKTINFPIPSVHGYLGELTFTKLGKKGNEDSRTLAGAEFTLHHADTCKICKGDGTQVAINDMLATSDENGKVSFTGIPSGHTYTLTETKVPEGYVSNGYKYTVTVAYDETTVTVTKTEGNSGDWDGKIVNTTYYELPSTGGSGTMWYTTAGAVLTISAAIILLYRYRKRRKEDSVSS